MVLLRSCETRKILEKDLSSKELLDKISLDEEENSRTPILTGYQLFHNYLRPHMALDNKTPAEACGIKINGNNKWITLIQNASKTN